MVIALSLSQKEAALLQELKEAYLFDLYHQIGNNETCVPTFIDLNVKYVASSMMKAAINNESMVWQRKKAALLHLLP